MSGQTPGHMKPKTRKGCHKIQKHDFDEMLPERERLDMDIQDTLNTRRPMWGFKFTNVEIKHVDPSRSTRRAIDCQAETQRARRAEFKHAEGEKRAAAMTLDRTQTLSKSPQAECICAVRRRWPRFLATVARRSFSAADGLDCAARCAHP